MKFNAYRYEATSVEGFVQQLAVAYIAHGFYFYVTGVVPERKDPAAVDRKLLEKYGVSMSKWTRARRKAEGLANVHYLRFERFWVLIASPGRGHLFFDEERFLDVRELPSEMLGLSDVRTGLVPEATSGARGGCRGNERSKLPSGDDGGERWVKGLVPEATSAAS
jgi:hypothetical protein